jgi:hypothetical protein
MQLTTLSQRPVKILEQIFNNLNADRHTQQPIADAGPPAFFR